MSQGSDSSADGGEFAINGREVAATVGLILVTIVAAMMVPAIRAKVVSLFQPKGA